MDAEPADLRLPVRLALHYLACARAGPDGIYTSSLVGPEVSAFAERFARVTLLAYEPPSVPSFEDRTDFRVPARDNVTLVSLGAKGTWREAFARSARIRTLLSAPSTDWDVLLLRLPNRRVGPIYKGSKTRRVAVLASGHSPTVVRRTELPPVRKAVSLGTALYGEWLQRKLIRSAGLACVNSEWLVDRYRGLRPDLELVRTSSRRAAFSYLPPDRMAGPDVQIMVTGRVAAAKGIFDALAAFSILKHGALPRARLHVVGSGEDEGRLAEHAARCGVDQDVVFHGWIPADERLFALYRQMDVLLHLSYAESFPRAVWEALAHGVLVVCTPVGGMPNAFADGREVLFVPVEDAQRAAEAVVRLRDDADLRSKLVHAGYERAREATLEATMARLAGLLTRRWPELGESPKCGRP